LQYSQSAPSGQSAKRALLAALALLLLACLSAPAAFAVDSDFTVDPASPMACEEATFTALNEPQGSTVEWDYENDTTFVPENTHTFAAEGTYPVTMNVTGGAPVTHDVVVVNAPPVASFDHSPTQADPGEWIVFESTSTDCDDSVASVAWDFDDGTTSTDPSPVHKFDTEGSYDVTLTVTDQDGASDTETLAVSVVRANGPPVAGFVWTPSSPVAGGEVQLFSTSVDAEGPLTTQAWDLDGDAQFDDALGSVATASFSAGDHQVSLLVTDGDGVSRTITRTITVAAPTIAPSTSAPAVTQLAPAAKPALMSPFPTVRLVGFVVPRGARITLLEVRGAPRGARVNVRCTGRGCPFRLRRRIAETGRVRLSQFPRVLVAGARIEVFVRAPGVIGKYVSFRIRAGKRPVRTDRCLMPGATTEPTRCS
jgi:PKD repeat protein